MNRKSGTSKDAADKLAKGIKRKTRNTLLCRKEDRVVLAGLGGEESIAARCRREGLFDTIDHGFRKSARLLKGSWCAAPIPPV